MRSEDVSGGEEILVAGYPLGNMVSDTIKVTKGIVSATKGMDNDVSQFEIDAVIEKVIVVVLSMINEETL